MAYVFISFVGNQHMGVLQPLIGIIKAGIELSSIELFASSTTMDVAERLEEYCKEKNFPPVRIREWNTKQTDAQAMLQNVAPNDTPFIFNVEGGMNYAVAKMALACKGRAAKFVTARTEDVLLADPSDGSFQKFALPEPLPVKDILHRQGLQWELSNSKTDICKICRDHNIVLPKNRLGNVKIGGIHFDLVWNDGSNRIVFLTNFYDYPENNKERNAACRNLGAWAATRIASGQLYDRTVYAIGENHFSAGHIENESKKKIQICIIHKEKLKKQKGADILRRILQYKSSDTAEPSKIFIESDTLIVVLGNNESPTLTAISSHNLPNVILCHTNDDLIKENARKICEYYAKSKKIILFEIDIAGLHILNNMVPSPGASNIHINITPGTKSQAAYLASLGSRHNIATWSIDSTKISRLDRPGGLSTLAHDAVAALTMRYPGTRSHSSKKNAPVYNAILEHMRGCLKKNKKWHTDHEKTYNEIKLVCASSYERHLHMPDGTVHKFTKEGGDWLEGLVAHVLRQAGAKHVHERVRIPWGDSVQSRLPKDVNNAFRIDMDVIASWKASHILVSCKATSGYVLPEVVDEVYNMAASINRFTLPILCQIGCEKAYFKERPKGEVLIFGWKTLCQPDVLAKLIDEFRDRKRTTSFKKI